MHRERNLFLIIALEHVDSDDKGARLLERKAFGPAALRTRLVSTSVTSVINVELDAAHLLVPPIDFRAIHLDMHVHVRLAPRVRVVITPYQSRRARRGDPIFLEELRHIINLGWRCWRHWCECKVDVHSSTITA